MEFLSKDRDTAVKQIKDKLYEQLKAYLGQKASYELDYRYSSTGEGLVLGALISELDMVIARTRSVLDFIEKTEA